MITIKNALYTLAATAACLCSCGKHSGSNQPGRLKTISVYYPRLHFTDIQSFMFNDDALLQYSDETIDSPGTKETRTYTFQYPPGGNLPSSAIYVDSFFRSGLTPLVISDPLVFVYDANNRLIADSSTLPYNDTSTRVNYIYSGDTITFREDLPGSPNAYLDEMVISNGSMLFGRDWVYTYGSMPNPLHDSRIADTYGPFFLGAFLPWFVPTEGLPVDFYSQNLPSGGTRASWLPNMFQWTKGPDGRIAGGTATNLNNLGAAQITFTYQ